MKRRSWSKGARVALFLAHDGRCHICGGKINGTWEVSHVRPLELDGEDTDDNCRPAHFACHRLQTSTEDQPRIAQAKRQQALDLRAKKPSGRWGYGKNSKFKKKVGGQIVPR